MKRLIELLETLQGKVTLTKQNLKKLNNKFKMKEEEH
jgi:hypothetical protein